MKNGYVMNPDDQVVGYLKARVKDNNGYCIYCDKENRNKTMKCPKACKSDDKDCVCGMYVKESIFQEGN